MSSPVSPASQSARAPRWLDVDEQKAWRAWLYSAQLLMDRLDRDLRASLPNGPVFRHEGPGPEMPSLEDAYLEIVGQAEAEAEGPEALRRMVEFLRVHEFRSEEPELEQIFMKAVRDAA